MTFQETTLFKGTMALLKNGTIALTLLAVVITIFFAVKNGIAWQVADEQEKATKKKRFFTDIILGVVIVTISGVIAVVFSMYGVNSNESANIEEIGELVIGLFNQSFS